MPTKRLCTKCNRLVSGRCQRCKKERERARHLARGNREHYSSREYRRRSAEVRENALLCWLCGEGERARDPWQADHYHPRDNSGPLLPAHRSCNAARGDRDADPHVDWLRLAVLMHDPVLELMVIPDELYADARIMQS